MKIEQIYTGCLAEAAYYIESNGEAAIIDPLRETDPYIERAKENDVTIKYIFETHFHADFVSGHIDLARKTGATIVYGPTAKTGYDIHEATDGEVFQLGDITITVLHTPGHTPESSTFLLKDEVGKEQAIFTGDTLFIGDVGRPDLAIKGDLTQEDLAGMLYDSLHNKIMPLPDDVTVYPAHGAGSACGKNMSSETFDSLGNQKKTNYALQAPTKEAFIKEVTKGILPPPQYFPKNAMLNKAGYGNIDEVMTQGNVALSISEFEAEMNNGALVLDTRDKHAFAKSFIPGAMFIGLDGSFATWVGALIENLNQPILIIADEGRAEEVVMRLARVGYDNAKGYLQGGFEAWSTAGKATDSIAQTSAIELAGKMEEGVNILDARKPTEYDAEHAEGATLYPLDYINDHLNDLSKDETYYVHCRSGYRSLVAASILKRNGYSNIIDVDGGFMAMLEAKVPTTDFVCPTKG